MLVIFMVIILFFRKFYVCFQEGFQGIQVSLGFFINYIFKIELIEFVGYYKLGLC